MLLLPRLHADPLLPEGALQVPAGRVPLRAAAWRRTAAGAANEPEFELVDTGVFDEGRYFDVFAEYAKAAPDDILIRITVANRGPEAARLHLLPTLWFRNTWSWGSAYDEGCWPKPHLRAGRRRTRSSAEHTTLGRFRLMPAPGPDGESPPLLFTENETNLAAAVPDAPNASPYVKDAFHEYVDPRQASTR